MEKVVVAVDANEDVTLPSYGSDQAAGADVRAYIEEDVVLNPGQSTLIPTGIKVEIPEGFEIQVRPRSGLAFKHGITVLNSPGTIDSDYTGEWGVILINHGKEAFTVSSGMRIAQAIYVTPKEKTIVHIVCEDPAQKVLENVNKVRNGFGSTGVK